MVIGLGQGMTNIPAHESSDATAKVVYQIPYADGYLIDLDYPVDSWLN
jgi:hypothetical protein